MRAKALTLVLAVIMSVLADESETRIEVSIVEGRLSGLKELTTKGRPFYSFRNIPFAKPPVGDLRFKDPEPAEGWEGTRDASAYPPRCIQQPIELMFLGYRAVAGEEDCLYLNVYTPKVDVSARLPVMVFIHGGAFFAGDSSLYPPQILLERDVVLVVPQYRLGIFGFLSTEDSVIPGNFGFKDQTLALRWVQQNVAAFGGDPSRVTLFGESAGGASIHYQMFIPEAKGLFSRAIMQSGTALSGWARESIPLGLLARKIASDVGCPSDRGSQVLLECLQRASATAMTSLVTDMYQMMCFPFLMVPRVDGEFIPDFPERLIASGKFFKVPIVAGATEHEGGGITYNILSSETLKQKLLSNASIAAMPMSFKAETPEEVEEQIRLVFDHFAGGFDFDERNADAVTQIYTDGLVLMGQDVATLMHSRHQEPPVFVFQLRHRGQRSFASGIEGGPDNQWVTHMDDLFYLFEGGSFEPLEEDEDLALRDVVTTLWTNFAATGNPTPDDSLGFKWEAMNESSLSYLVLQPEPVMEADTRKERRDFWLGLPALRHLKEAFQGRPREEL
ncbi:juvenile hormone esterase-like [Oratosquilla oratoria]|uniref:juvenile hormone esterase-like n=1 Tax=Oratosquilla oratoria TaxID=337810 RepID=UPI003F76CC1C